MDVNIALEAYKAAKQRGDKAAMREYRSAILGWVKGGGFAPSDPNWRKVIGA